MAVSASVDRQKGNILFLILMAVVLLGALTYVIARPGGESTTSMNAGRLSEEIKSQAQIIRSALLECDLVNGLGYPDIPASSQVRDLGCKIDLDPSVLPQAIFTGTANRFLPPPPKPFGEWVYDIDSSTAPATVSIRLSRSMNCSADAAVKSAFDMLAGQYSPDEVSLTCDGSSAEFTLFIVKGV